MAQIKTSFVTSEFCALIGNGSLEVPIEKSEHCTVNFHQFVSQSKVTYQDGRGYRKATTNIYKSTSIEESQTIQRRKLPILLMLLTVVQISIFLWIRFNGRGLANTLRYSKKHKDEVWRLITYILVHTDTSHLSLNITMQCLFGSFLENEQGLLRTAIVVAFGGIAGALGTYSTAPEFKTLIGSSASCYALFMANITQLLMNYGTSSRQKCRLSIIFLICGGEFLLFTAEKNGWFCLPSEGFAQIFSTSNKICKASHFFGAIGGLLISIIVFKCIIPATQKKLTILYFCRVLSNIILLFLTGIGCFLDFQDIFPKFGS